MMATNRTTPRAMFIAELTIPLLFLVIIPNNEESKLFKHYSPKSEVLNYDTVLKFLREMLLFEKRNIKFTFTSQKIIQSHKFFEYMTYMEANDFIEIDHKNHHKTTYHLTEYGRFHAICSVKLTDCPLEYIDLNRGIDYAY